jgi:hypothetical protein
VKQFIIVTFVSALSLSAQTSSSTVTTDLDLNGRRVETGPVTTRSTSPGRSETTETMQSINGRMVPLERVEERVLRDDASGRVVERVIHRYDPQGNPTQPVKETIEEQKRPDGSSSTQISRYRGDINGSLQLVQKSIVESHTSGAQEITETTVQRPNINGGVDTVEKQSDTTTKDPSGGYHEEALTYRRGADGSFYTAVRKETEHTKQGSEATDNTAEYEVGSSGQLELHSQTVAKTVIEPNGAKDIVVDVFGKNVPGTVDAPGSPLKLMEQQLIERKPGPSDSVVETVNVRRPSVADPKTLGPARQLSETVCRGDCKQ